ncbi:MAG: hypothetical protein RIC16_16395 [Rhodospirillales bacterium]
MSELGDLTHSYSAARGLMPASHVLSNPASQAAGRYDLEDSGPGNDSGELSFLDVVDIINPLHHIPGVSTVYRNLTGDEISPAARVAGGTLYFGPIGFAVSTVNAVVETVTGDDVGGHFASLFGEDGDSDSELAENDDGFATAIAGGSGDDFLSIDDWLAQPAPGTAEAASALGAAPAAAAFTQQFAAPASGQSTGQALSARTVSVPGGNQAMSGAVPVEALPADILAALMSGNPVRPVDAVSAGTESRAPAAGDGFGSLGVAQVLPNGERDMTPERPTPLTDGLAGLGPALVPDVTAFSDADAYGAIASDGGWFTAAMNDALGKYDNSAALRQQVRQPLVDVSQ